MEKFEMVAKTLAGLEEVLAEELRNLGAENVEPGRRMVSFEGDKELLYKANLCLRTALRVLKPFYKFTAHTPDELYSLCKEFDWSTILSCDKTLCIDTVAYSEDFTHSQFVTYKVKDAIVDWFRDRYGDDKRPSVRLKDADVMINVHISAGNVTLSLDSSGESLHKRGYRVAQTDAPINEVLAAGIILKSGYRGDVPFVDPMCGSGTFLIEAALIAANINPGIYRKSFAFEHWDDFDQELFDSLYNDDSREREPAFPIVGADISAAAIAISERNIKSAGVGKYVELRAMPIAKWEEAPQPGGILVTNPPYGERISSPDMEGLYATIGNRLKFVFTGYHAWIIGYRDEYFHCIGLSPSQKKTLYNGSLECELREYVIFEGDKKSFKAAGGKLREFASDDENPVEGDARERREFRRDRDDRRDRRERRGDDDRRREFKREFKRDDDRRRGEFKRDFKRDDDRRRGHFTGEDKGGKGDRFDRKDRFEKREGFDRRDRFDRKDRFEKREGFDRRDRFDRKDRFEKREGFDRRDRFDRDERRGRYDAPAQEPESENPLAKRRNPEALRTLNNKRPSLPSPDGPVMRPRGWRKKGDEGNAGGEE